VRPSKFANERGGLGDTMAVFALVGDSDGGTNKLFSSARDWRWRCCRAGRDDAGQLRRRSLQRRSDPAIPDRRHAQLSRQKETRAQSRYGADAAGMDHRESIHVRTVEDAFCRSPAGAVVGATPADHRDPRPAYCRSRAKAILAADPGHDRSAQFMSAVRWAASQR